MISGYPCSGKTHRSAQLVDFFNTKINTSSLPSVQKLKVHHVNLESLGVSRTCYDNARTEKDARAAEMSAVKRLLERDAIVIADGLNYIKGFRYQFNCEAKALGTGSCVVSHFLPVESGGWKTWKEMK
jgi:protein KTI12